MYLGNVKGPGTHSEKNTARENEDQVPEDHEGEEVSWGSTSVKTNHKEHDKNQDESLKILDIFFRDEYYL